MTYWIAVTADIYELPLAVEESAPKLAEVLGITPHSVYLKAMRDRRQPDNTNKEYRIIKVEEED